MLFQSCDPIALKIIIIINFINHVRGKQLIYWKGCSGSVQYLSRMGSCWKKPYFEEDSIHESLLTGSSKQLNECVCVQISDIIVIYILYTRCYYNYVILLAKQLYALYNYTPLITCFCLLTILIMKQVSLSQPHPNILFTYRLDCAQHFLIN